MCIYCNYRLTDIQHSAFFWSSESHKSDLEPRCFGSDPACSAANLPTPDPLLKGQWQMRRLTLTIREREREERREGSLQLLSAGVSPVFLWCRVQAVSRWGAWVGGVQPYRLSAVTSRSACETPTERELVKVLIMDEGVSIACLFYFYLQCSCNELYLLLHGLTWSITTNATLNVNENECVMTTSIC